MCGKGAGGERRRKPPAGCGVGGGGESGKSAEIGETAESGQAGGRGRTGAGAGQTGDGSPSGAGLRVRRVGCGQAESWELATLEIGDAKLSSSNADRLFLVIGAMLARE